MARRKKQKNYYLLSFGKKLYRKKWTHTFLWDFFSLWIRNWGEQRDENKIKIQYVFKKLLFKTIIVFTGVYFESYCKIPARSNKSILWFFYHKIHLYVKGILNQNKQIKTKCPRGLRPMLETAPLVTSFLNDPLFYSAISEVNCILAFFYSDYYDFLRFIMHSFVTHTFCRNQFFRLR